MKTGHAEIVFILDMSGSMGGIKTEAVDNFNRFLREQKEVPGTATMSLILFNSMVTTWAYDRINLSDMKPLGLEQYRPDNFTPLLDTISDVIDRIGKILNDSKEEERPEKVIFAIMTDGLENYSHRVTRQQVFEKITLQEKVYKWNFIFMGANQDSFLQAGNLGIKKDLTTNFTADAQGVSNAYTYASSHTRSIRTGDHA
jgi:uncharacterized protein YegL